MGRCLQFYRLSIDDDLICFQCPVAEQVHISHLDSFRQIIKPETSGFAASASGGDFTALRH